MGQADKVTRLGEEAAKPKRIRYKPLKQGTPAPSEFVSK
jgi:hypothetical protein